jgi:hypothetical protein
MEALFLLLELIIAVVSAGLRGELNIDEEPKVTEEPVLSFPADMLEFDECGTCGKPNPISHALCGSCGMPLAQALTLAEAVG